MKLSPNTSCRHEKFTNFYILKNIKLTSVLGLLHILGKRCKCVIVIYSNIVNCMAVAAIQIRGQFYSSVYLTI